VNLRVLLLLLGAWFMTRPAYGQKERPGDFAWRLVVEQDSVLVRYLFYPLGDSRNNGVVLRLDNLSASAISYRFEALFRGDGREASAEVAGELEAFQSVTGDADGLFFIPFPDSGQVSQLGLRGFRITRRRLEQ